MPNRSFKICVGKRDFAQPTALLKRIAANDIVEAAFSASKLLAGSRYEGGDWRKVVLEEQREDATAYAVLFLDDSGTPNISVISADDGKEAVLAVIAETVDKAPLLVLAKGYAQFDNQFDNPQPDWAEEIVRHQLALANFQI